MCDSKLKRIAAAIAVVVHAPLAAIARPQTVDSLKSATGNEDTSTILVRWLYAHFGPLGLIVTLVIAAGIFYMVRRNK